MYQDLKLSDRARVIKMAVESGLTDLDTIEKVYNTFAQGGDLEEEPSERRKVGDHYLTLEQYKELQRDTIRKAAVQKALTRNVGVAPIINGEPASSCIYTFTDNYGRKYRVAGTQTFAANPEKYGFEVAGPLTEGMEGNMYLQMDNKGVPYHATMITGYTDNGEPLLTYSSGHAGGNTVGLIPRDRWNNSQEPYEHYLERFNRTNSPEADYHKNAKAWSSPQYETYRFVGTPEDNAAWETQYNSYTPAPMVLEVPQMLNNRVTFAGHKKEDGGPENGLFTPKQKELPKELIPKTPMKVGDFGYDENGDVIIQGFNNIDKDIQEGNWLLYQKDYRSAPGVKYYKNKDTGEYFRYNETMNPSLNLDDYEEISSNDIRKMLPKRDYIGGENYRLNTVKRVPGLLDMIRAKADAYGINPNLMLHRFMKEGIVDQWVNSYNNSSYAAQKTFFDNLLNQEVAGYGSLGLDDAGSNLLQGLYELKDPTATWEESDNLNEQGRPVKSVTVPNMNSGLEIKAADMAYRKRELEKRGLTGDNYINAAYNMGLYNKKLNDPEFIESTYSVPDYGVFKNGGKIHIKPENRGKFTALKKRTGHSASWFKAHGTPAQRKMATFALNARKWKHGDGGYLMTKL